MTALEEFKEELKALLKRHSVRVVTESYTYESTGLGYTDYFFAGPDFRVDEEEILEMLEENNAESL